MHRLFQLQVEKGKVRLLGGAPHPREIILVGIAEFHQCEQHGVGAGFFGRTGHPFTPGFSGVIEKCLTFIGLNLARQTLQLRKGFGYQVIELTALMGEFIPYDGVSQFVHYIQDMGRFQHDAGDIDFDTLKAWGGAGAEHPVELPHQTGVLLLPHKVAGLDYVPGR